MDRAGLKLAHGRSRSSISEALNLHSDSLSRRVAAFAIVCVFEKYSSFAKDGNTLSFKAFGAEFTGPAAPAMLWIVCFLALVFAIRLVTPASGSSSLNRNQDKDAA
jgi:hypothetical protein